jgi:RNA polymerase sigma-70 factor (ECF subfamily)
VRVPTDAEVIAASIDAPAQFGALFDRHATTLFRFLVRRVGPDEADALLGELFRIAFERRAAFDTDRPEARPWLYGIASNLIAKHRRREARRLAATARLAATEPGPADVLDAADERLDAAVLWPRVAAAVAELPAGERDALLLFAWEHLSYEQIGVALGVPVGTVRSRLNRARARLRELAGERGEQLATTTLRPDRVLPVDPGDPGVFKRKKEHLMSMIDETAPETSQWSHTPAMYPRLVYRNEHAALEHLTRVFQFVERRESRMEGEENDVDGMLAWLEFGDGVVMIGRATDRARDVHHLYTPEELGHTTVVIQVLVRDIDAHYAHALAEGAHITMPLEDAFYGFRRYEADDLEGHHWHFHEPLADIRERTGEAAD